MTESDLKQRFKAFALRIIAFVDAMPTTQLSTTTILKQIIRSGTSPYANYCAACLAKSEKDFLNKLKMVEEELDETLRWTNLLVDSGKVNTAFMDPIIKENEELLKIIVSSIVTIRNKINSKN